MAILYILGGLASVLGLSVVLVGIGKLGNWLKRVRGVTELTPRQRRLQAQRYRETTNRKFLQSKRKRSR